MSGEERDVFEVMRSTRAMRRLEPDPVPRELVQQLLEAANCAPNGANRQSWGFIVVYDPELKRQVQHYYARAFETVSQSYATASPPPGMNAEQYERQHGAVRHLTEHFHEAPVWIVACVEQGARQSIASGASVYPAVQNILLAARALGLGATLTTRHRMYADEVDALFGLPDTMTAAAIVPIGYPSRPFGPVRRGPIADVTHEDRWGTPFRASS